MFTIEKHVDIPKRDTTNVGRKPKYPFREMEIGDSFFVRSDGRKNVQVNIVSAAHGALGPGAFATRSVVEGGVEGIRAWRIK